MVHEDTAEANSKQDDKPYSPKYLGLLFFLLELWIFLLLDLLQSNFPLASCVGRGVIRSWLPNHTTQIA